MYKSDLTRVFWAGNIGLGNCFVAGNVGLGNGFLGPKKLNFCNCGFPLIQIDGRNRNRT